MTKFSKYLAEGEKASATEKGIVNYISRGKTADKIAKVVVDSLKIKDKLKTAEHIGDANIPTDKFFSDRGVTRSKPKTDAIINGKIKTSIKQGRSQLGSPGMKESIVVFQAVAKKYDETFKKRMTSKINKINERIEKEFLFHKPATEKTENKVRGEAEEIGTRLTNSLDKIFNDIEFKNLFVEEQLTGELKFGKDSKATANYLLSFTNTGENVKLKSIQDKDLLTQISNVSQIVVSYKPDKAKGINKAKGYATTFRNVIRIRDDKSNTNEGLKDVGNKVKEMWIKLLRFLKRVISEIKNAINKGLEYFLDFMELTPVITQNELIDFGEL